MPTLVEIGPSNASQGQHRRMDATEQVKNMTLAGSRTQVPGFRSECQKKQQFDVSMGANDGAEICELVGLYLLTEIHMKHRFHKHRIMQRRRTSRDTICIW